MDTCSMSSASSDSSDCEILPDTEEETTTTSSRDGRPQRRAAVVCNERLHTWLNVTDNNGASVFAKEFPSKTSTSIQLEPSVCLMDIPIEQVKEENISDFNTSEFIPDMLPSAHSSTILSIGCVRDIILEHKSNFINSKSEDPLLMEVRREFVLADALTVIRYSQEDLHNPLQIKFSGEEGVDLGGVRREFWSLFLHQLTHSIYVTGKMERLHLQANFLERKKNTFFHLGQLVVLSILEDGPGIPIFSEAVTDYILEGSLKCLDTSDLPDYLRETLDKMSKCSSPTELKEYYSNIIESANEAEFLMPTTKFTSSHVPSLQAALIEHQISSSKEELDQFIKGLDTHQLISALRQEKNQKISRVLFSGMIKPVTAAAVRQQLKFKYGDGNIKNSQMVTAQGFLTFLQATKGTTTSVNNINLKPEDVLMWMTGATHIPAAGFHKKIDVEFGETTVVNTCALILKLKLKEDMTPAEAVDYYTELIINSQTFSME